MDRAPLIPAGWNSNLAATAAATEAFAAGKPLEECEQAAFAAAEADEEFQAVEAEADAETAETLMRHEYWSAICNVVRGVGDLSPEDARKAAAVISIPTVSFAEWKRRAYGG